MSGTLDIRAFGRNVGVVVEPSRVVAAFAGAQVVAAAAVIPRALAALVIPTADIPAVRGLEVGRALYVDRAREKRS